MCALALSLGAAGCGDGDPIDSVAATPSGDTPATTTTEADSGDADNDDTPDPSESDDPSGDEGSSDGSGSTVDGAPDVNSIDDLSAFLSSQAAPERARLSVSLEVDGDVPRELQDELVAISAEMLIVGDGLEMSLDISGDSSEALGGIVGPIEMKVIDDRVYMKGFMAAMFGVESGWLLLEGEMGEEAIEDPLEGLDLTQSAGELAEFASDFEVLGDEDLDGTAVRRLRFDVDFAAMAEAGGDYSNFEDQVDPLGSGPGVESVEMVIDSETVREMRTSVDIAEDGVDVTIISVITLSPVGDDVRIEEPPADEVTELDEDSLGEGLFGGAFDEMEASEGFGADIADSSAQNYGDDPTLDALYDSCEGGDGDACDELYWTSPSDSAYEEFGNTCGGRGFQVSCGADA